jgi:lipoprotein NlpI
MLCGDTRAVAAPSADELQADALRAWRNHEPAQALELASAAIQADETNVPARLLRATIHAAAGRHALAIADLNVVLEHEPKFARAFQFRGVEHFKLGQIEDSISDFDRYLELQPDQAPEHWQRGISYYYAGRYHDGRKQFELHRRVNPQDVENAVWHFLCVAREEGVDEARRHLIPIERDKRVPMMEIFALFAGRATPDEVLTAAQTGSPDAAELNERLFYAHLYLGLYYEALGQNELTREHVLLAANKYPSSHYMGDVARVHAARLLKSQPVEVQKPSE